MAIHRPQSAAMDCRATLAMTKVNDWHVCNFLLPYGSTDAVTKCNLTLITKPLQSASQLKKRADSLRKNQVLLGQDAKRQCVSRVSR